MLPVLRPLFLTIRGSPSAGHVGIPSNATDTPDYPGTAPAGVCAECGEAAQTNFVRVMQGQGTGSTSVPWMEMRGVATEEAQRAAAAMDE